MAKEWALAFAVVFALLTLARAIVTMETVDPRIKGWIPKKSLLPGGIAVAVGSCTPCVHRSWQACAYSDIPRHVQRSVLHISTSYWRTVQLVLGPQRRSKHFANCSGLGLHTGGGRCEHCQSSPPEPECSAFAVEPEVSPRRAQTPIKVHLKFIQYIDTLSGRHGPFYHWPAAGELNVLHSGCPLYMPCPSVLWLGDWEGARST